MHHGYKKDILEYEEFRNNKALVEEYAKKYPEYVKKDGSVFSLYRFGYLFDMFFVQTSYDKKEFPYCFYVNIAAFTLTSNDVEHVVDPENNDTEEKEAADNSITNDDIKDWRDCCVNYVHGKDFIITDDFPPAVPGMSTKARYSVMNRTKIISKVPYLELVQDTINGHVWAEQGDNICRVAKLNSYTKEEYEEKMRNTGVSPRDFEIIES